MARGAAASAFLAASLLGVLGAPPAAAARDPYAPLLSRIDSLYSHGQAAAATALIDSLIGAARAGGNRGLDAALTARRSSVHMYFRHYAEAVGDADHAIAIARARRDTLTWCRALLSKARVLTFQERASEAAPLYRELLPLARRLRNRGLEGTARLGLAYIDLQAERLAPAELGYRVAVRKLSDGVDVGGELSARVGLARTLRARGKPRDAQAMYREVIGRALAVGDLRDEADAWNNLGTIEVAIGEPARATSYFERALERNRRLGRPTGTQVHNLALLLIQQGEFIKAKQQLEGELSHQDYAQGSETGFRLRTKLGVALTYLGQPAEASRLLTGLWALRDSVPQEAAVDAGIALATVLRQSGRESESIAVLETMLRRFDATLPADSRSLARSKIALAELAQDRVDLALAQARLGWRESPRGEDRTGSRATAGATLLRCFHRSAMGDSARWLSRELGVEFDRVRAGTGSRDWSVTFGANASAIAAMTAHVLLDSTRSTATSSRIDEAFNALQRYKGRQYAGGATATTTAASLRASALRDGEVFLDLYWSSEDSTLAMLALTRNGPSFGNVVASHDPGPDGRVRQLYASIETSDAGARRAGARAVLGRLLGPALDAALGARRVYFSPPSWLALFPLGAMLEDLRPNPAREVVLVPSATWLAQARLHSFHSASPPRVVTLVRGSDEQDRPLAGPRDEAKWLATRYGAVGPRNIGGLPLGSLPTWFARGEVLHVAAHSRAGLFDPWGSAVLLGPGHDVDAWLTMREIADAHGCAPLVVLATCNATIGSNLGNESVYGLASGFISAGARTVVSTLWDADDRATAQFTRHFYTALEQGRTAGEALRQAQRIMAADPATRSAYFWAGFVIVGDPDVRVRLVPRGMARLTAPAGVHS